MSREEELQALVDEANAEGRDLEAESLEVIKEIEEAQKVDRKKALTIKDRLKRRLISGYVEIPFQDDLGEFNIKFRLPSPAQRRRFAQLTIEAEKALDEKDEKKMDSLDDEMTEIIGKLCLDFDAEYIRSGENFGVDIIQKLIKIIIGYEPVNTEAYKFFRSPPRGQGSSGHL